MIETLTSEQIAQHYKAAIDSVNLINGSKPSFMSDEDWIACIKRNKDHLAVMITKNFWTTEDLTPLRNAAA